MIDIFLRAVSDIDTSIRITKSKGEHFKQLKQFMSSIKAPSLCGLLAARTGDWLDLGLEVGHLIAR